MLTKEYLGEVKGLKIHNNTEYKVAILDFSTNSFRKTTLYIHNPQNDNAIYIFQNLINGNCGPLTIDPQLAEIYKKYRQGYQLSGIRELNQLVNEISPLKDSIQSMEYTNQLTET